MIKELRQAGYMGGRPCSIAFRIHRKSIDYARRRKRPVTEMNLTRQMSQSKIVRENLTVQDDQVVATLEARL